MPTFSDNPEWRTYGPAMERGQLFIRLKLDVDQPIDLGEFVGAFTALASEYDRFIRAERPGQTPDATLYVKEVRHGSIEADLITWGALALSLTALPAAYNILDEFVERLGDRLRTYGKPGGRLVDASKSELRDFGQQVAAIASTPGSNLQIAAMEIQNGEEVVRTVFKFETSEAREIQQRVEEHKRELDHSGRADHLRVLMTFTRSDITTVPVGKSTGERVKIDDISDRALPLIYASDMAEQAIKHEIREAEDDVFKKGFVVDVNVETRNGRAVAYRITHLHQVIDLDE